MTPVIPWVSDDKGYHEVVVKHYHHKYIILLKKATVHILVPQETQSLAWLHSDYLSTHLND